MEYVVCKLQNTPEGETPSVSISEHDPGWEVAFAQWKDGKTPTDSPLWGKTIVALTRKMDTPMDTPMETSGLDLTALTIDDIINAMRMNGIRQIQLDTKKTEQEMNGPYAATVIEWYGSVTKIEDCQCSCHCGGFDGDGVCKQPCDDCSCAE